MPSREPARPYAGIERGGDQAVAFQHGLVIIAGFVLIALVLGVIDLATGRKASSGG